MFKKVNLIDGYEILFGDVLVAKGYRHSCSGHIKIIDKNLYDEYEKWLHEKSIENLLQEERYPEISQELIMMGLPSGKPFNNLEKHPLWKNYVDWYTDFHKTC